MPTALPRSRHLVALVAALALAGGTLSACRDKGDDDDSGGDDDSADSGEDSAAPVRVAAASLGPVDRTLPSSSTIESEARADVLIQAAGTVEKILVEEGQLVRAGDVLAILRNPELRGELDKAEASFRRTREGFDSVKALFEQGFVSRNDYEEAALGFDTARLTVKQAREAHGSLRLASAIDGTVSLRDLRFGELASPGRLAFQVVDLGRLKLELHLPEKDLAEVKSGQLVLVRSEVLDGVEARGRVLRISPVVSPQSGTVKVTVGLESELSLLRPGMFVHVDVVVDTREQALLVAKKAIFYEQGEPAVFVVEDGKVARRKLTLGYSNREFVEATAGVSVGEQVVTVGQGLLRDGASVRVVEEPAVAEPEAAAAPGEPASETSL